MSEFLENWKRKTVTDVFKGGRGTGEEDQWIIKPSFQLQYMGSFWNKQPIFQHLGDNEVLRNSQCGFVNRLTTKQPDFPLFGKITGLADVVWVKAIHPNLCKIFHITPQLIVKGNTGRYVPGEMRVRQTAKWLKEPVSSSVLNWESTSSGPAGFCFTTSTVECLH